MAQFLIECPDSDCTHPPVTGDVSWENQAALNMTTWYPILEIDALTQEVGPTLIGSIKTLPKVKN